MAAAPYPAYEDEGRRSGALKEVGVFGKKVTVRDSVKAGASLILRLFHRIL